MRFDCLSSLIARRHPEWAGMRRSAAASSFAHPPSQLTTITSNRVEMADYNSAGSRRRAEIEAYRWPTWASQPGRLSLHAPPEDQSAGYSNRMTASPALQVNSLGQHERAVVIVAVHGLAG